MWCKISLKISFPVLLLHVNMNLLLFFGIICEMNREIFFHP